MLREPDRESAGKFPAFTTTPDNYHDLAALAGLSASEHPSDNGWAANQRFQEPVFIIPGFNDASQAFSTP